MVDHSPIACLLASTRDDNLGQLLEVNRAGRTLFGMAEGDDAVEGRLSDLVAEESVAPVEERLRHVVDNDACEKLSVEVVLHGHDSDTAHTMHLRSQGSDLIVVQLVPRDGASTISRVLAEQQRFRGALLELSELAHTTEDDDEFCQRLIERAVEVVPGAQGGSVQLHIDGTEQFRFAAAVGYDLAGLQEHTLDRRDFFRDAFDPAARIVRDFGNTARRDDVDAWLREVGRLDEILVNVSAPVLVAGAPVAFLSMDNFDDRNAMTQTSVEMTTVLGSLIGDLWRRRLLEAEVRKEREAFRHQALHDPLTQLPNRRNLDRCLTEVLAGCRRSGNPACVLFVDIDDFKGVNDRLGHDVGDMLLEGVAEGLSSVVRGGDVVGRWGGDEFLIVPRRFDTPEEAAALAERILQRFETDLDLTEDGLTYRARLSVGIGWTTDSVVDASTLVSAADEALYAAKAAGKGVTRFRYAEAAAA